MTGDQESDEMKKNDEQKLTFKRKPKKPQIKKCVHFLTWLFSVSSLKSKAISAKCLFLH